MIESIFLLTATGEVLIEKHFRKVLAREAVCQDFSAALAGEAGHPEDLPPILTTARHLLINVFEDGLFLVAVVGREVSPLLVIEFLRRIFDVFLR